MSKNKLGLVVGTFAALFHAVWSILVAFWPSQMQSFIMWVLTIHHISLPYMIITPFVVMNAVILVIYTFVVGYILGWILAALFNSLHGKMQ